MNTGARCSLPVQADLQLNEKNAYKKRIQTENYNLDLRRAGLPYMIYIDFEHRKTKHKKTHCFSKVI